MLGKLILGLIGGVFIWGTGTLLADQNEYKLVGRDCQGQKFVYYLQVNLDRSFTIFSDENMTQGAGSGEVAWLASEDYKYVAFVLAEFKDDPSSNICSIFTGSANQKRTKGKGLSWKSARPVPKHVSYRQDKKEEWGERCLNVISPNDMCKTLYTLYPLGR